MFGVWNTEDVAAQHRLCEAALEHNVHFVDPRHNIIGRPAFLKMVQGTQAAFPGATYARRGDVGMQNNFCRYHWHIHRGDVCVMEGFDVTEVNDSGKIVKVIGFFGPLAAG